MILFVDGTLTINSKVTVSPGGFLAFIAKGITIGQSVGDPPVANPNADIEGVYVTDGMFTVNSGTNQFVGKGMFIADRFSLNRNLGGPTNIDYPSELFLYDPRFLVSMPEEMQETPILWQEINP